MRGLLLLLLLATTTFAQGMGPASRVDSWQSKHNQKRLRFSWEVLPAYKPTKLPDGSEEPPKAPWPFLVYVFQNHSKASEKLQLKVFDDTRFVLAAHAIKPVKIKPHKAIDVPYLAGVQGIKDPTLIVIDRDFKVVGVIKSAKDFTDKKVLSLMAAAAKDAYAIKVGGYITRYLKLLQTEEKLWKQEKKMEELRSKAINAISKGDKGKGAKYDKEADEIEKELEPQREDLANLEVEIQDSLALKGEKKEELPTTVGTGKKKRELTPAELEAIKAFREFARDQNPIVRAAAVEDLGGIDSAVMVELVLKASNDVDPRVVDAAGKALSRMTSAESLEAMHNGLKTGNAKAKTAALLGFAGIARPYPLAIPDIARMLAGGNDEVRRAAIRALENQKDPAGAGPLIKALDDKLPGLKVMAATALGEIKATKAAGALVELLTASDWSLQKAAAEALGKIRAKESIGPLLERFEKEKGLLSEVLYKALVAITGQDFRYSAENWRKWWDRWGNGFQVPTDAELAVMKKKREEAMKGYYDPNKKKYHTIETLSRKMVFVIDISSSMNDKIVIPPYAPDKVKEEFPDRVKMEIAKKELIALLATLDGNIFFNIITFAGRVKPWQKTLVSGSMRTAAIKFVSKLKALEPPRGGRKKQGSGEEQKTNTYGAMMEAFGLQDEAVPNWKARTKVDTIFFVTDGTPTTGKIVDVPKLVDAVTDLNRTRGVIIHVILFDKEQAKKMRELAVRNGGQCVVRGWTGEKK